MAVSQAAQSPQVRITGDARGGESGGGLPRAVALQWATRSRRDDNAVSRRVGSRHHPPRRNSRMPTARMERQAPSRCRSCALPFSLPGPWSEPAPRRPSPSLPNPTEAACMASPVAAETPAGATVVMPTCRANRLSPEAPANTKRAARTHPASVRARLKGGRWRRSITSPVPDGAEVIRKLLSAVRTMVPSVDEIYPRRPRVRPTTGQALGLLQHHWREPSRTGTPNVGIAQGVASLVVDDVAPVCPQVTGVSVCAELPAPGIEDDVPAVAARQPTARVERCAEFIGRLWGGQDDPEVGMAIDADERVSRRPAAPIRQVSSTSRATSAVLKGRPCSTSTRYVTPFCEPRGAAAATSKVPAPRSGMRVAGEGGPLGSGS